MIELPALTLLGDLGLKPTEILILFLLWQNVKDTRVILGKLTDKVNDLEKKLYEKVWTEVNK